MDDGEWAIEISLAPEIAINENSKSFDQSQCPSKSPQVTEVSARFACAETHSALFRSALLAGSQKFVAWLPSW
jgi:hypothetical protein